MKHLLLLLCFIVTTSGTLTQGSKYTNRNYGSQNINEYIEQEVHRAPVDRMLIKVDRIDLDRHARTTDSLQQVVSNIRP